MPAFWAHAFAVGRPGTGAVHVQAGLWDGQGDIREETPDLSRASLCFLPPTPRATPTRPSSPQMGAGPMPCFSTRVVGCSGTWPSAQATSCSWASPGRMGGVVSTEQMAGRVQSGVSLHTRSHPGARCEPSWLVLLTHTDSSSRWAGHLAASHDKNTHLSTTPSPIPVPAHCSNSQSFGFPDFHYTSWPLLPSQIS